jgi:hypothetical protein
MPESRFAGPPTPSVAFEGLFRLAGKAQRIAMVDMRFRTAGKRRERLADQLGAAPGSAVSGFAEQAQCLGMIGRLGEQFQMERFGVLDPPRPSLISLSGPRGDSA